MPMSDFLPANLEWELIDVSKSESHCDQNDYKKFNKDEANYKITSHRVVQRSTYVHGSPQ